MDILTFGGSEENLNSGCSSGLTTQSRSAAKVKITATMPTWRAAVRFVETTFGFLYFLPSTHIHITCHRTAMCQVTLDGFILLFGQMFQTKSSSKSFLLQICCLEFPIPDIAQIKYSRHKIFHFILCPQIFHICLPIQDNDGIVTSTAKYSFFCGNGTVFDQQATFKLSYFHTFTLLFTLLITRPWSATMPMMPSPVKNPPVSMALSPLERSSRTTEPGPRNPVNHLIRASEKGGWE